MFLANRLQPILLIVVAAACLEESVNSLSWGRPVLACDVQDRLGAVLVEEVKFDSVGLDANPSPHRRTISR